MSSPITPALNSQVIKRAMEICNANNWTDRKSFNKAYDMAIKELGYTPAYFKSIMRQIGPNPF